MWILLEGSSAEGSDKISDSAACNVGYHFAVILLFLRIFICRFIDSPIFNGFGEVWKSEEEEKRKKNKCRSTRGHL